MIYFLCVISGVVVGMAICGIVYWVRKVGRIEIPDPYDNGTHIAQRHSTPQSRTMWGDGE